MPARSMLSSRLRDLCLRYGDRDPSPAVRRGLLLRRRRPRTAGLMLDRRRRVFRASCSRRAWRSPRRSGRAEAAAEEAEAEERLEAEEDERLARRRLRPLRDGGGGGERQARGGAEAGAGAGGGEAERRRRGRERERLVEMVETEVLEAVEGERGRARSWALAARTSSATPCLQLR